MLRTAGFLLLSFCEHPTLITAEWNTRSDLRTQKAFVLIKAKSGHEKHVAENLMKIPETKEVHIIPGEWDLLLVLETERELVLPTDEKMLDVVMEKIGTMQHIVDTNTMIPSFSRFRS
jgi:DNA-binding Lrp family transcriptional regulator